MTSCDSLFNVNARSIIDFAITSGDLSKQRSFVPTCKI